MTTAEKARAYDEAIKKAAALYKASEPMSGCNVILETLFPELAESEDEKIKKRITLCLEECVHSDVIRDYEKDECVAWLENQGQVKESHISQHENRTYEENDDSLTCEDEKVRKALLELVHDTTGDELWIDYNVHKEEALDWLERQVEHANFRNKIQIGDKVTRNEAGVLVNLSQLNRVAKPRGKQGEKEADYTPVV